MKVIFDSEVSSYLKELSELLYERDYFCFSDAAVEYIDTLTLDIYETLPNRKYKSEPLYFSRYGKNLFYAIFVTT
jgi:hypothetical protein